ncbi:MAG: phosphatase PAP2 family protein [Verrucomicrobiota bacterium]
MKTGGWFRGYVFIDYATQLYIALVGGLILCFQNETVPGWPWLAGGHAAALVLVHLLLRAYAMRPANRILDFLRHFYPVLLYTAFYRETGALNRMFVPDYLDAHFIAADQALFGFQPSIAFMDHLPWLWFSESMYAAYFSYYLMIVGVGLALFLRDRRQFFHYVSVISFVFYVCYLIYIALPVMGPRAFFREIDGFRLPDEIQAYAVSPSYPDAIKPGLFRHAVLWVYEHFEGPGAAFPSSHVAIAISTVWFSFRYLRRLRWAHLVIVLLLCTATVYCRYHYVVDVAAGALTTALLLPLGNRLYRRFSDHPPPACGGSTAGRPAG